MSGTISHLRRLAVAVGRRCYFQTGSQQLCSVMRYSNRLGHRINVLQKCGVSSLENVKEKLTGKELAVNKATETLKNLNEDDREKFKQLKLKYLDDKEKGRKVPDVMTNDNWVTILRLESKTARRKFYKFLRRNEVMKLSEKQKKLEKAAKKPLQPVNQEMLFNRIVNTAVIKRDEIMTRRYQACRAFLSDQHLVFDLALREQTVRETRRLVNQLRVCYGINREHPEAFHLHFTGIPENGPLTDSIENEFMSQNFFIDYHKEDICDVFPAERLVYLTSDSKVVREYNSDDIYVIGGLIDTTDTKPYSYAKARKLGIRTACIPLDRYYRLKKAKTLTLDVVLNVLLEMKFSQDWEKAMRHIPGRYWDAIKIIKN